MPYYLDLRRKWRGSIRIGNKRINKEFNAYEEAVEWEASGKSGRTTEAGKIRMARRRHKYIKMLGPCVFCGTNKNVTPHHIDEEKKTTHNLWSRSDEFVESELRKCISLCDRCHKIFHSLLKRKSIQHGTISGYAEHGCRCELCMAASSEKRKRQYAITKSGDGA